MENIDYEGLKKRGFLKQRQEGFFVLRTRMSAGVYKKDHLEKLSEIAQRYGRGFAHATVRQGIEVPFIKFEDIERVDAELKEAGIPSGTSGPRLRATAICPGNNWCRQGLVDTFSLAKRIEEELGIICGMDLPHKFKIAISGCPNGCMRPQASDIGVHGQANPANTERPFGYSVYVGGCGGRAPKAGLKLDRVFSEDEALRIIGKVIDFYRKYAKSRQRLGLLIEEFGKDDFLKLLYNGIERNQV